MSLFNAFVAGLLLATAIHVTSPVLAAVSGAFFLLNLLWAVASYRRPA